MEAVSLSFNMKLTFVSLVGCGVFHWKTIENLVNNYFAVDIWCRRCPIFGSIWRIVIYFIHGMKCSIFPCF